MRWIRSAAGVPNARGGFRSASAAAGSPQWQAIIAASFSSGAKRCAITGGHDWPNAANWTQHARHARWAAGLVTQAAGGLRGADEAYWAARLDRHLDDLRAAYGWLAGHDPALGLQLTAGLHWFALWRCHSEVFRWADVSAAAAAGSSSPFYPEALAS